MNAGKKFEADFKNSIHEDIFFMRLKDGTASWSNGSNTRFQSFNACDCILHYNGMLYLTELKSHKGKSIPFSTFRESQIRELAKITERSNELALVVFNFRELEQTYIVMFPDVIEFIDINIRNGQRKSFPIEWVSEVGFLLPQQKKKVRYKYDVKSALLQIEETLLQVI